jgi:hypothetical protein
MENRMKALGKPMHISLQAEKPCTSWLQWLLMVILVIFVQQAAAEENPYTTHYQAQNQGNLHSQQSSPEPQLFSGKRREDDNIMMLENGYDLMGFSEFEAGDIAPAQAIDHGRNIKADTILVYVKKAGNANAASKMEVIKEAIKKGQSLTEKDVAVDPGKYRYYASYWAKLPPPVLGVHVIKLLARKSGQDSSKDEQPVAQEGVRVIAVINGSAAEQGGVLRGDQLLTINQEKVNDAATLSSLVRRFKGNTVTIKIERQSEPMSLQVNL